MQQTFTIGTFGIVTNEQNHVLMCLRTDCDYWNLPGGGLEKWESPSQWVIREIKEETGFDAEVTKLLGIYSKSHKDEIVFSFECRIIGGKIILNEEAKDIKFFPGHEIPENTLWNHIERIKDYFENQNENKVIFKMQQGRSVIK